MSGYSSEIARYQLIAFAIAAAPPVYMLVTLVMKLSGALPENGFVEFPADIAPLISLALLGAGVVAPLTSFFLKPVLMAQQRQTSTPPGRFHVALVSMALSESGAVLGLVLMLMTGNLLYGGLLCGLSFAVTCFHIPGRHWLAFGDATQ